MANGRLKTASFGPAFLAVALLFCGFALVACIFFRFLAPAQTYEEKRAQARRDKAATINREAAEKLYGPPKWIDKTKGTVQLPIDTAMDLVIKDYRQKAVHPSQVKVDNPYPYGLQTAATSASPAPAASPRLVVYSQEIKAPANSASAAAKRASPAPGAPVSTPAAASPSPAVK